VTMPQEFAFVLISPVRTGLERTTSSLVRIFPTKRRITMKAIKSVWNVVMACAALLAIIVPAAQADLALRTRIP